MLCRSTFPNPSPAAPSSGHGFQVEAVRRPPAIAAAAEVAVRSGLPRRSKSACRQGRTKFASTGFQSTTDRHHRSTHLVSHKADDGFDRLPPVLLLRPPRRGPRLEAVVTVRQPVDVDLRGQPVAVDIRRVAERITFALQDKGRCLDGLQVLNAELVGFLSPLVRYLTSRSSKCSISFS